MGVQHPTNVWPGLLRLRAAYVNRHGLRDYKLSGRSLMRLVLACPDKAVVDEVRRRSATAMGRISRWRAGLFDDLLKMFGQRGFVALVGIPYHVTDEGRADMAALHAQPERHGDRPGPDGCGLRDHANPDRTSVPGGPDAAAAVSGPGHEVEPGPPHRPPAIPPPGTTCRPPAQGRARLLQLARERAEELSARSPGALPGRGRPSLGLSSTTAPMRAELNRITALISEVESG